jgi:hypothetical protein
VNNAVAPYYSQGGDGAADLIMGLPRHIHQLDQIVGGDATAPELNVVFPYWGGYINDRFQMTPKLTITAGLRYDLSIPIYGLSDACCAVYQPDANGGTVALPGVADGVPQHYLSADKREFAPRLSIAYAPTRKQVVRVGYGIFHDSGATQISTAVGFADGASPGGGLDHQLDPWLLEQHTRSPSIRRLPGGTRFSARRLSGQHRQGPRLLWRRRAGADLLQRPEVDTLALLSALHS